MNLDDEGLYLYVGARPVCNYLMIEMHLVDDMGFLFNPFKNLLARLSYDLYLLGQLWKG